MVDGVGAFKDVRKLRDETMADILGLVADTHRDADCRPECSGSR
jgi:hypothetical protein